MILIDFSGLAYAPIAQRTVAPDDVDLLRHIILNNIRLHRNKYKQRFGEIVIVADGGGNWRKKVFPQYKYKRDPNRDESPIDWDAAFNSINQVIQDLDENFPYKVIRQWGCEADDSIAELVHYTQEFGNWEDVMIVSADYDFIQLHKYKNVHQYSTVTQKIVKNDDPVMYQKLHFLNGCKGDGVPSVVDDDDQLKEGRKKVTLTAAKKEQLLEDPKALGDTVYRNWHRNKVLIDLTENRHCPEAIRKEIIDTFENQDKSKHRSKVLPFLISNNCRQLIENVSEFIN